MGPRRFLAAFVLAVLTAMVGAACNGTSGPGPTPPPAGGGGNNSGGVVSNTPPQIRSLTSSQTRAEVESPITLTATVEDAETPVANLTYAWSAPTGTFSGTGSTVTWVAGQDATTPADVILTLTITEPFNNGSLQIENKVSSNTTVRLHNSPKELRELSLRFLGDFSNSKVSPDQCVSEFSDSCRGKQDERADIDDNRHDFEIIGSTLRHTSLSIAPSRTTATVHTFCAFTSRVISASPREEACQGGKCPVGSVGSVQGDCWTTNVYEKGRWWICESHFTGSGALTLLERAFFGIRGDR